MILYRTPFFDLVFRRGTFIVEERNNRSGVVVIPKVGDRYLLVEVERHAIGASSLEFPRGYAEAGEEPWQCALRELEEETGIRSQQGEVVSLGQVAPNTGLLDSIVSTYLYESTDSENALLADSPEEVAGVRLMQMNELSAAVRDGVIIDGFTLSALTLLTGRMES